MTVIGYLRKNLDRDGDFMIEYKVLSVEDKADLRHYAADEMAILGVEIEETSRS